MMTYLNSISEHWFTWQWAMLWQTAVLIAIIWTVDLCIRRWAWPQVRYALWMLVLVKLLIPPTWTSPASITSHIPTMAFRAATVMERADGTEAATVMERADTNRAATVMERANTDPKGHNTVAAGATPGMSDSFQSSPNGATQNSSPPAKGQYPEGGRGFLSWKAYAMVVWLVGMAVLGLWLILRLTNLRREHIHGWHGQAQLDRGLPERFFTQLEETAAKLGL
ncbi:MAG: M56 family metallopeptidase, partial [Planctomycetota bacterium]